VEKAQQLTLRRFFERFALYRRNHQMTKVLTICFIFMFVSFAGAEELVVNKDGNLVLLKDDHTWVLHETAKRDRAKVPPEKLSFETLLKTVVEEALQEQPQSTQAMKLSRANQIATLIQTTVEANWSVPMGVREPGDMVVTIRIRFGRDGAVQSAEILDANYAEDPNFHAMAESVHRAIQKASPIKALRDYSDYYDHWRDVTITFLPPV
tara:strand:- start:1165 stop:1791 length:627 start_codon:yes stop_codon:yes gene_type:complete